MELRDAFVNAGLATKEDVDKIEKQEQNKVENVKLTQSQEPLPVPTEDSKFDFFIFNACNGYLDWTASSQIPKKCYSDINHIIVTFQLLIGNPYFKKQLRLFSFPFYTYVHRSSELSAAVDKLKRNLKKEFPLSPITPDFANLNTGILFSQNIDHFSEALNEDSLKNLYEAFESVLQNEKLVLGDVFAFVAYIITELVDIFAPYDRFFEVKALAKNNNKKINVDILKEAFIRVRYNIFNELFNVAKWGLIVPLSDTLSNNLVSILSEEAKNWLQKEGASNGSL